MPKNGDYGQKPDFDLKQILTGKPHHMDPNFKKVCELMDLLTPQARMEICHAQMLALVWASGNKVYFSTNKSPPFCVIAAFGDMARELLSNNASWLQKGDYKGN